MHVEKVIFLKASLQTEEVELRPHSIAVCKSDDSFAESTASRYIFLLSAG